MDNFNVLYNTIILFSAFIALFFSLGIDFKKQHLTVLEIIFTIGVLLGLIFLFGFRNRDTGTDTEMYYWQYKNYRDIEEKSDFLISYVYAGLNDFSKNPKLFFVFMSTLYLVTWGMATIFYSKIIKSNPFLVFFSLMSLFFFEAMGINTIRQGVSLGFFALSFAQYCKGNRTVWKLGVLIPWVIAVGFHLPTLIPILIFLLSIYFTRLKIAYYYILYFLTLVLSIFNVSILSFKNYLGFLSFDERRSGYLNTAAFSSLYDIGFKPQFVAFNTFFLLVFIYIKKFIYDSEESAQLLRYFLLASSLFFMVFQLPYSDRWGVMSWIVIPFLLAPLFKVGMKRKLATATVLFLTVIFLFFLIYQNGTR